MTLAERREATFAALDREHASKVLEARRSLVHEAAKRAKGNQATAAELLGISHRQLTRWLDEDPTLRAAFPPRGEVIKRGLARRAHQKGTRAASP